MRFSRRFINFASLFGLLLTSLALGSCKGRTVENMEPTGDTVEVVILQADLDEN
ncbi:MAG: hypothetical protein J1F16_03835 [Muribaculaceae bacterium]|nr:hypothetical protein [Muribaculaceae bacterium]